MSVSLQFVVQISVDKNKGGGNIKLCQSIIIVTGLLNEGEIPNRVKTVESLPLQTIDSRD